MPVIFRVTLRRDYKGVPAGTSVRIATSGENDHSTAGWIVPALRKLGYYDDQLEGIGTSTYWDWQKVSTDHDEYVKLMNDLAPYHLPHTRENNSSNDSKGEKSSSSSAAFTGGGIGKFIMQILKDDEEGDEKKYQEAMSEEISSRDSQISQAEINRSEDNAYKEICAKVNKGVSIAPEIFAAYFAAANLALENTDNLYYSAKDESKLEKNRIKEIKQNIQTVKGFQDGKTAAPVKYNKNVNPTKKGKLPKFVKIILWVIAALVVLRILLGIIF